MNGYSPASELVVRITDYLCKGGLFNPEQMEHDKVRALLIDCREALSYLEAIDKVITTMRYGPAQ